jgi:DNA adenine methylase
MMKLPKPLFIWAGGKTKVLKYHTPYLPNQVTEYSEPFFGGGAMFIYVMKRYNPKKAYINDVNESIINIYRNVKDNVEDFIKVVDQYQETYLPLSKEDRKKYFFDVRYQHAYDYENWDKVFEAGTLYFLMKTGFNGIWQINQNTNGRYGTPAGLLNQKDKVYDKTMVYEWNHMLKNVDIHCGDYSQCPSGDLNYLDPPYRDSFADYGTGWNDQRTEELLEYTKNLPGTVLFCNRCDGSDFFESRKGDMNLITFPITYTAGRRKKTEDGYEAKKATEVLLWKS